MLQRSGAGKSVAPVPDVGKGAKPGSVCKYVFEETIVVPATLYQARSHTCSSNPLVAWPRSGRCPMATLSLGGTVRFCGVGLGAAI